MNEKIAEHILSIQLYNTYYNENDIENEEMKSRTEKFKLEKPFLLPRGLSEEDITKVSNIYYGATNQTQARMRRISRIMQERFPEEYNKGVK
jgi:hypothetical protein